MQYGFGVLAGLVSKEGDLDREQGKGDSGTSSMICSERPERNPGLGVVGALKCWLYALAGDGTDSSGSLKTAGMEDRRGSALGGGFNPGGATPLCQVPARMPSSGRSVSIGGYVIAIGCESLHGSGTGLAFERG